MALTALSCCATAAAADGDLDLLFGDYGVALSGITDTGSLIEGLALQADGKIVICDARYRTGGASGPDFFVARFTRDGVLDTTFSFDGKTTIDFQLSVDFCSAVAVQADGRIVVAGASEDAAGNYDFALARLNADGTLDKTFGNGTGKQLVAFDNGGGNDDIAKDVAIQPDGRIVAAGYAYGPTANNRDMAVVRLLADGTRDTTFNLSGRVLVGFEPSADSESDDEAESVAIDDEGRIVVAGNSNSPDLNVAHDFAVARLLPGGQLDADFDADGRVTLAFDVVPDGQDVLRRCRLDHAGRLVLAGWANAGTPTTVNYDMAMARLLPDGSPDSAFGLGGKVVLPFDLDPHGSDTAYDVVEQSNGALVIAGAATLTDTNGTAFYAAIARVGPDGALDAQFAAQGRAAYDLVSVRGTQVITSLALQGSQIIAAGQTTLSDVSQVDNFVMRFESGLVFADSFE